MSVAAIELASRRARTAYKSPQFRRVYVAGARAALASRDRSTCPYKPDRGRSWGRTWRRAWLRGFDSVASQ